MIAATVELICDRCGEQVTAELDADRPPVAVPTPEGWVRLYAGALTAGSLLCPQCARDLYAFLHNDDVAPRQHERSA